MDTNFNDQGTFYATQSMIKSNRVLSMSSGIMYDINNPEDVQILCYMSSMIPNAKKDIAGDNGCWFGEAAIITRKDTLVWEY